MGRLFYNLTNLSKEELQKINVFTYYRCNFKNLSFKLMLVAIMWLISIEYVIKISTLWWDRLYDWKQKFLFYCFQ